MKLSRTIFALIVAIFLILPAVASALITVPADGDCIEAIVKSLNAITSDMSTIKTQLEIIKMQQSERMMTVDRISTRSEQNSASIGTLEREVSKMEGSWGTYMTLGGFWGVVGGVLAVFGVRKFGSGPGA